MELFKSSAPVCALAPMQDITGADFMALISQFGAPDFFVTEYFRVHETSRFDAPILKVLNRDFKETPVSVQFIGEDEPHIKRCIDALLEYPQIKMLDLNMGCPAPKIYKKNVGGGLLKNLKKAASVIKTMREAWPYIFSVKTRLGFEYKSQMSEIVKIINGEGADFLTLHGRTVKQLYRGNADFNALKEAAEISNIPVIANGDITSAESAFALLNGSKLKGAMFGRQAVRNPWIFRQFHELKEGKEIFRPTLADVYSYIEGLYKSAIAENPDIRFMDGRMKKFLNFIALGVDENGDFLRSMRLAKGVEQVFEICKIHLLKNPEKLFANEPYKNLCSRPNHEL